MPNDVNGAFLQLAEVLTLPVFQNCRVVGGELGLNKRVSSVNITDIPDYYNWVHAGELLVTNCFGISGDPLALEEFIPTLSKRSLAGVCIKPRRYIKEITPEMIDFANKLSFPIIELAADVNFIDITKAVFDALLRATENVRFNDFVLHLLNDIITDGKKEFVRAQSYGIDLSCSHLVIRQLISEKGKETGLDIHTHRGAKLLGEVNGFFRGRGITSVSARDELEDLIILSATPSSGGFGDIKQRLDSVRSALSAKYPGLVFHIGCGLPHQGLGGLKQSGDEAKTALKVCAETKGDSGGILGFGEIGLYRLIYASDPHSEVRAYIDETIGTLIKMTEARNVEFIPMLEEYFRYNGNLSKLSEATFTHYNTVVYRLKRVEELTGLDLRDSSDRFRLETALNLYKLIEIEGA